MGKVKLYVMDREERAAEHGAADRYYGRQPVPHMWLDSLGVNFVNEKQMSTNEVQAYWEGWRNQEEK